MSARRERSVAGSFALLGACLLSVAQGCQSSLPGSRNAFPAPSEPEQNEPIVRSYTELPGFNTDLQGSREWTLQLDLPSGLSADDISAVLIGVNTDKLAFNSELCNVNSVRELCMDSLRWVDAGRTWEIFDRTNNSFTVRTTSSWDRGSIRERQAFVDMREREAVADGFVTIGVIPSQDDGYSVSEIRVEIYLK